jgi:hypothetical protein
MARGWVGLHIIVNVFSPQPGTAMASSLTGGEMASVLQVLKVLLLGLVDKDKLKCWKQHIDIIAFLKRPRFSELDLAQLTKMVNRWKSDFYQIYQGQANESGASSGAKPSFEHPNLKTISHWAEQIHFLGPPWLQLTGLWECKHQDCKLTMRNLNMRHLDKSILIVVCSLFFFLFFYSSFCY